MPTLFDDFRAGSEARPICERGVAAPCDVVLDPTSLDTPDHVCLEVARLTTARFADGFLPQAWRQPLPSEHVESLIDRLNLGRDNRARQWPLGADEHWLRALELRSDVPPELVRVPLAALPVVPLGLVVTKRLPHGDVSLFASVRLIGGFAPLAPVTGLDDDQQFGGRNEDDQVEPREVAVMLWEWSDGAARIDATGAPTAKSGYDSLVACASELGAWYRRTLLGRRVSRGGRPRGVEHILSPEDIVNAIVAVHASGYRATQERVARHHLSVDVSTLQKWLRRHGVRWRDVLDKARRVTP